MGYVCNMLGFEPFEDETKLVSEDLLKYFTYSFPVYDKSFEDKSYVVGDNSNLNQCLASIVYYVFTGCCSHCFNLAVKDIT